MNSLAVTQVRGVCAEVPAEPIDQAVIRLAQSSVRMFKHAIENENMDGRWDNWKISLLLHRRALVRAGVSLDHPIRKELEGILAVLTADTTTCNRHHVLRTDKP